MLEAVRLSRQGMEQDHGGPFGCVIVRGDEIVGRGWNQVTTLNDPTAHAEVMAIREACHTLDSFHLSGCEIYASCEPCPMCMGAIYWARPQKVYFSNTHEDAARIGFSDSFIYEELKKKTGVRSIPMIRLSDKEAIRVFEDWMKKEDRVTY